MSVAPDLPEASLYWLMRRARENFGPRPVQHYKPDGKTYQQVSYDDFYEDVVDIGLGLAALNLKKGNQKP